MDTREIIEALRTLPLHRRYSVALEAGVIGKCCPDCGCYAGTCHPWSWKDSGQDCTCSENPANVCLACDRPLGAINDSVVVDTAGDSYHSMCATRVNAHVASAQEA